MNTKKPKIMTIKEAAELIEGLSEYRVKRLCLEGLLKYHRFGNKYMISEREIYNYFQLSA